MPGSSTIYGLLRCYNKRHIVPNKNRTYTFDVDFIVGFEGERVIEQTAIMTHFVPQEDDGFVENAFYTVYGKVASIDSSYVVEDGVDPNRYQFVIDADVMALMPQEPGYPALPPRVTISGPAGAKKSSHKFLFDVRNYVLGVSRLAGHACLFPENGRFRENPPFPGEGKMASVTGTIRGPAGFAFGDRSMKRLMLEVNDCSFLGVDTSPSSPNVNRKLPTWSSAPKKTPDKGKRKAANSDDENDGNVGTSKRTRR